MLCCYLNRQSWLRLCRTSSAAARTFQTTSISVAVSGSCFAGLDRVQAGRDRPTMMASARVIQSISAASNDRDRDCNAIYVYNGMEPIAIQHMCGTTTHLTRVWARASVIVRNNFLGPEEHHQPPQPVATTIILLRMREGRAAQNTQRNLYTYIYIYRFRWQDGEFSSPLVTPSCMAIRLRSPHVLFKEIPKDVREEAGVWSFTKRTYVICIYGFVLFGIETI